MSPQLIALVSAVSYGAGGVFARLGLRDSTPFTAAYVALGVRTVGLWSTVFLTGGIPTVTLTSLLLVCFLGALQTATSLLTFTGIHRIGAARNSPLRNTFPLWSAVIAITVLKEDASLAVLTGTVLVVLGIGLISRSVEKKSEPYRWWYVLFPLLAGFFAGVAFPIRRYALSLSNEPLFFSALLAAISFACLPIYLLLRVMNMRFVWHRKALPFYVLSGVMESAGALLSMIATSVGQVVLVAPIVATTPFWTLVLVVVFLRGLEHVNSRTVLGTLCVIMGSIAIILRG